MPVHPHRRFTLARFGAVLDAFLAVLRTFHTFRTVQTPVLSAFGSLFLLKTPINDPFGLILATRQNRQFWTKGVSHGGYTRPFLKKHTLANFRVPFTLLFQLFYAPFQLFYVFQTPYLSALGSPFPLKDAFLLVLVEKGRLGGQETGFLTTRMMKRG